MKAMFCPICRTAVDWNNNPYRPFCSQRCQTLDLGAWSSENYRVPEKPEEEKGENWSEEST